MDIVYGSSHLGESWVSSNVNNTKLQHQNKLGLNGGIFAAGDAKRVQAELNKQLSFSGAQSRFWRYKS